MILSELVQSLLVQNQTTAPPRKMQSGVNEIIVLTSIGAAFFLVNDRVTGRSRCKGTLCPIWLRTAPREPASPAWKKVDFMRRACLAALLLALPTAPARAQQVHGFYLQGNTGIFFQKTQPFDATTVPQMAKANPTAAERADAALRGGPAPSESGSLGYGFGSGLRVEVQGIHTAGSPPGG